MKYLLLFICFIHNSIFSDAITFKSYQQVLDWSKKKIISEISAHATQSDSNILLSNFPVILNENCGKMNLLFIKNTPQCGAINCKFLLFKKELTNQITMYYYINEIEFAAVRLLCYPQKNQTIRYYLVTSLQESNAQTSLQLAELVNDQYQNKTQIEVDYENKQQSQLVDNLWEKGLTEPVLLKLFKLKIP